MMGHRIALHAKAQWCTESNVCMHVRMYDVSMCVHRQRYTLYVCEMMQLHI